MVAILFILDLRSQTFYRFHCFLGLLLQKLMKVHKLLPIELNLFRFEPRICGLCIDHAIQKLEGRLHILQVEILYYSMGEPLAKYRVEYGILLFYLG